MLDNNGHLVISLDFELAWGVFDVLDIANSSKYFENTRDIIPSILKVFNDYQIHATWATVGMLFNKTWKEWEENIPSVLPDYEVKKLSSYIFGKENKTGNNERLFFAPDLIKLITQYKGQEIGTHTYSHYYCQEVGQEIEAFKEDLRKAIELGRKMNVELKSLVFPRNQLNPEYLQACFELGIENVRSNPQSWYWNNAKTESLLTKLARTGDAYIDLGKKSYTSIIWENRGNFPVKQKASRFLRPYEQNKILNSLKLSRIKKEMNIAAKKGEIYHLWWHPHNFGTNPTESINDLIVILEHYKKLNFKYNFQSLNMWELGNKLRN